MEVKKDDKSMSHCQDRVKIVNQIGLFIRKMIKVCGTTGLTHKVDGSQGILTFI